MNRTIAINGREILVYDDGDLFIEGDRFGTGSMVVPFDELKRLYEIACDLRREAEPDT